MLPAAARMRRPAEFAAALRSGARGGSRAVTVHAAPSGTPGVRVGFVVARSVGPAVVRNRVRRRLRHLLLARLAGLRDGLDPDGLDPDGLDIVVRAHPESALLSSAALGPQLDAALARATERAQARGSGGDA